MKLILALTMLFSVGGSFASTSIVGSLIKTVESEHGVVCRKQRTSIPVCGFSSCKIATIYQCEDDGRRTTAKVKVVELTKTNFTFIRVESIKIEL